MHSILEDLLLHKRREISEAKRLRPLKQLERIIEGLPASRDFRRALTVDGLSCIAELKRATPLKGVICADYDPPAIAQEFEQGGAKALSVLTDERFFQGTWEHLDGARSSVSLPVLRKDFILEEYQLFESRARGADAVLLIAGILGVDQLRSFIERCRRLGLGCIAECHNEVELKACLNVQTEVVAINNRNLMDFTINPDVSLALRDLIPDGVVSVSESGISDRSTVERLEAAGFDAMLVGEALMGARDRVTMLRRLLGA